MVGRAWRQLMSAMHHGKSVGALSIRATTAATLYAGGEAAPAGGCSR